MLILLISFSCIWTVAVASWLYQNLDVINWEWQSSVVVDDWLYIDGGQLYARANGAATMYFLGQTISVDLSQSWTNATFSDHNFQTQRPTDDAHWTKRPALFYNPAKELVNQWGGWPLLNTTPAQLFTFQAESDGKVNWIEDTAPITNDVDQTSPALAGAAFVTTDTAFYSLGGNLPQTYSDPYIGVQGLLKFDYGANSFQNLSSLSATSSGFYVGGEAAYARNFGNSGFLVFIGGIVPNSQVFHVDGTHLVDMSEITLYDIENDKWYHQTATGDIPPPRQFFCSVGATSRENSFEMFILGGSTNSSTDLSSSADDGYRSVYTLSIPAFHWFQSPDATQPRRAEHNCRVIGKRQMLVIGGSFPSDYAGDSAEDPWPNGVGIFDMTAFAWANIYNATAEIYSQPNDVRNYYTSRSIPVIITKHQTGPIQLWEKSSVKYITSKLSTYQILLTKETPKTAYSSSNTPTTTTRHPTSTTPTPSSTSSSTPAPANTANPTHLGTIIGGSVGGGVALIAAVAMAILYVRHRRRKSALKTSTGAGSAASNNNTGVQPDKYTKHELDSTSKSTSPELPSPHAFFWSSSSPPSSSSASHPRPTPPTAAELAASPSTPASAPAEPQQRVYGDGYGYGYDHGFRNAATELP